MLTRLHVQGFKNFVGILTAIVLCIYAMVLVVVLVFGVGAAILGHNLGR